MSATHDQSRPGRPLEPIWDQIPLRLTTRKQWVGWKYGFRKGQWTKIPIAPNGGFAAVDDPTSWASFEHIQCGYFAQLFDGVGYVLDEFDFVTGLDFDHCLDDGQIADPKITGYVKLLDSYTEVSPSGTGLRTLVRASLFGLSRDRRLGRVEVYDNLRFVSITGRHYPCTPTEIVDRQVELNAFHRDVFAERIARRIRVRPPRISSIVSQSDADLLDRARRARNGDRFARLYDEGAWQADFPSQSEADLWLLARLMFWTRGDEARADRLFRQSKLMREKWEIETYREHTMERARE